ncbi:HEPN domain-containing protein [Rhizobium sp. FKL33]|uniref:HEPN domain-containing protein n=1 Tax=Rhizobium sp. FKL33 TaxID=2562307 RepID=UPI0010C10F91|nr:HEPN domain-containing protein [Rhizobium sp. FKL33]
MERFGDAIRTFDHAIDRARQLINLYDALCALRRDDPANDDALRSAYFQAVSSFDFFVHEVALIEATHRFQNSIKTRNISLPMEIMTIADAEERIAVASAHIRKSNSYKAFVDPAKLAELLSCYCDKPWQKIIERINEGVENSTQNDEQSIKGQLKSIWKRRNQIAHEADVNPTLAGIRLWPIDKPDTELTIAFIAALGSHIPNVISEQLANENSDEEIG